MDFFMIRFRTNCGNPSVLVQSPSAVFHCAKAVCGLSEGVDVVQYRDLPQDDLADNVRRLDVLGIDRRIARGSGGEGGELGVVELDRTTKGAAVTCLAATAVPEVKTWPVAVASSKETTLPVKTWPGKNLKVTSTSWPGSI
jgi:hypothetical protein